MNSIKKRTKKRTKKMKKRPIHITSKITILLISGVIISLLYLTNTLAWFSSSDYAVNNFKGSHLSAEISETFSPNNKWQPGQPTIKEVRVKNIGEKTAFVRVSLYEFLLSFQIDVTDQTGNGNLKTVKQPNQPEVDYSNTDTWKNAAENQGTYDKDNSYYVANKAIISDPENRLGMYLYKDANRKNTALNFVSLNFSDSFKETIPDSIEKSWVYQNGYFYYLKPLEPGLESEPLLNSVTLSDSIPNKYKGSLYKLKVYMDAHDLTTPLLDGWNIDSNSELYSILKSQLK